MNEEELKLMVARARDAEGSPSQPPTGLVDEARTAARRRHRLVTVAASGVVAAVVLTSFAGPRLLGDETDPVVDHSLSGVDTGELAAHGGPCPSALPAPVDDVGGHGFGTSTHAEREPRFAAPETAWVCQYSAQEIGQTDSGGTAFEWSLTNTPRRLDDALLSQVTEAMNGLAVDPGSESRSCTADLGPRYALVSSADGDLTGIVVDDYGCQDVRLTDNPFVTAPGDPQEGGTVPGVLTGADGLAATLATWWDTSPTAQVSPGPTGDDPVVAHPAAGSGLGLQALIVGSLTMSNGCLMVGEFPVVWPHGTTWEPKNQAVHLADGQVVALGDRVRGGGGYLYLSDLGADFAESLADCPTNQYGEIAVFNAGEQITVTN